MIPRLLFALIAPLLLTGCFITPGKFDSELTLERDGSFAFTYSGEIVFLGLSKLARMNSGNGVFEPKSCVDEASFDERECSEDELAEQRAEWEAGADERAAKNKEEARQMASFLGGIDPADPQANENLRQLLLRHKGWNKVESKGDGVFDIEFSVTGHLSHDLMFPVIEGVPTTNIFVQAILREGNQVRINAPGFSGDTGSGPSSGMMGGMAGLAALGGGDKGLEGLEELPRIDGTLTIRTTGVILANNTDEGASQTAGMQVLTWKVSSQTKQAPSALIKLGD